MEDFKRVLMLFCVLIMCVSFASAQKVGSSSMQFLKVMPSARATAMGEAYSVLASGADALFWNPSGLALVESQEISSTYVDWIFDTRQGAIGYALSLGSIGAIGVQLQFVDFGEFEETSLEAPYIKNPEAPGMTGRSFHPFSYLVGVTYARGMTERFSVGGSIKYAHESLFSGQMVNSMVSQGVFENVKTWANGLLFDFGVRYETGFRSIAIGASVQNFGADVLYAKESTPAPLLFRFGIAANVIGPEALLSSEDQDNKVTFAFDLFQPNDYSQQAHVGVEYSYAQTVALRAGYKLNYDFEGLTVGGGVKHSFGSVNLALDYSYGSIGQYLGNIQRISLGAILQ